MAGKGYETVTTVDELGVRHGQFGKVLYKIPWLLVCWLILLLTYAAGAVAFAIFVISRCPSSGHLYRVLPTKNLPVEQFYSGLALSIIFTPAALLLRRVAYDVALLHPFALATKLAIEIADIDLLMDPGIVAMGKLFKYSIPRASVQALIMAGGAFLVPVGTLLVFPGMYSAPTRGIASVGMPTRYLGIMTLDIEANGGKYDFFLEAATNIYAGRLLQQVGDLHRAPQTLGPVATVNLTYHEGVTYHDIVTYNWKSGCKYTDKIKFTEQSEQYAWMFNVTMPNGDNCDNVDAWDTKLCITNTTDASSGMTTTYYAVMGTQEETMNFQNATAGPNPAISAKDGAWISRVACTPTMTWQMSDCTYLNGTMSNCTNAANQNNSLIDSHGLDKLPYYISQLPLYVDSLDQYTFGFQTIMLPLIYNRQATGAHQYQAPTLQDYDNMYGLVAQSLAATVSAGYYGVLEVPTTGSTPGPVYLVRMHILGIIVGALVLCPLSIMAVLFWSLFVHRMPLRSASFLTIANAVRGPWWDSTLWGTCLMGPKELRRSVRGLKVMFGATVEDQQQMQPSRHVGFAQRVGQVVDSGVYFGVTAENGQLSSRRPLKPAQKVDSEELRRLDITTTAAVRNRLWL